MKELRCSNCKRLLAIKKKDEWSIKNLKGITKLKDNGEKRIECICGKITQIGT